MNEWCIRGEPILEEGSALWSSSQVNMSPVWLGWVPSSAVLSPLAQLMKSVCTFHPGQFPLDILQVIQASYVPNWHQRIPHTYSCIPWLPLVSHPCQCSSNLVLWGHPELFLLLCFPHSAIEKVLGTSLKSISFLLSPLLLLQDRPPLPLYWTLLWPPGWPKSAPSPHSSSQKDLLKPTSEHLALLAQAEQWQMGVSVSSSQWAALLLALLLCFLRDHTCRWQMAPHHIPDYWVVISSSTRKTAAASFLCGHPVSRRDIILQGQLSPSKVFIGWRSTLVMTSIRTCFHIKCNLPE